MRLNFQRGRPFLPFFSPPSPTFIMPPPLPANPHPNQTRRKKKRLSFVLCSRVCYIYENFTYILFSFCRWLFLGEKGESDGSFLRRLPENIVCRPFITTSKGTGATKPPQSPTGGGPPPTRPLSPSLSTSPSHHNPNYSAFCFRPSVLSTPPTISNPLSSSFLLFYGLTDTACRPSSSSPALYSSSSSAARFRLYADDSARRSCVGVVV